MNDHGDGYVVERENGNYGPGPFFYGTISTLDVLNVFVCRAYVQVNAVATSGHDWDHFFVFVVPS